MFIILICDYIDLIVKIFQGVFFIAIPCIAYKTYLAAKDQLKNPINAEYKKLVFSRLHTLSKELHNYIDRDTQQEFELDLENQIIRLLNVWRGDGSDKPLFDSDKLKEVEWLTKFIIDLESNPLIPKPMREEMYFYYSRLQSKRRITIANVVNRYLEELTPRYEGTAGGHLFQVQSQIASELGDSGFGYLDARMKSVEFRRRIQDYFDKFETIDI